MKLPRVRLTIRRMMVAVAIVAIALEGSIVWIRYRYSSKRALDLTKQIRYLHGFAAKAPSPTTVIRGFVIELNPGAEPVPATGETIKEWTTYLDGLARKAERESRHPWLTIEPDPPYSK